MRQHDEDMTMLDAMSDKQAIRYLSEMAANYRGNTSRILSTLKRIKQRYDGMGHDGRQGRRMGGRALELLRAVDLHVQYERLKRGGGPRAIRRIDLAAFLSALFQYADRLMTEASIDMIFHISHASFVADVDVESMLTIAGHLLSNAIRYREEGTPVEVRVGFHESFGKLLNLEIINYGRVLPEKVAPHILEPYYMYHPDDATGNGLGLTVVDQLIGVLEGVFYYHSDHGETLFHFSYSFDAPQDGIAPPRWEMDARQWKTLLGVMLSDALPVSDHLIALA